MSCAWCGKPTYPEGNVRVGAHGHDFCSMACADDWERDPVNTKAVAASYARANCSAYAECASKRMMFDLYPQSRPVFASCEADCPMRRPIT